MWSAYTQNRPHHLIGMQGSKVMHQSHAGTLAPEEPDELIAHVRVCGGAGWVTTGSTRKEQIGKEHTWSSKRSRPPSRRCGLQEPTHMVGRSRRVGTTTGALLLH